MKFKLKRSPQSGDVRVIKKFLFLPLRINNEVRWLETVEIYQRYRLYYRGKVPGSWNNIKFIDKF